MSAQSNSPLSRDMNVLNDIHESTQHRSRFSPAEELHASQRRTAPVSVKEVFLGFEIKPSEELTCLTCLGIYGRLNRLCVQSDLVNVIKAILCSGKRRDNVTGGICLNNNTEKAFDNFDNY